MLENVIKLFLKNGNKKIRQKQNFFSNIYIQKLPEDQAKLCDKIQVKKTYLTV